MTPAALTDGLAMRRLIARIRYECTTIDEEGYDRDGAANWYATDRLAAIRSVIDLALSGDALAFADGLGNGPEQAARAIARFMEEP